MATPCYVFDLDGTLADLSHRLHHIQGDKKDWRAFFAAVAGDEPIAPMVELFRTIRHSSEHSYVGTPVVIVSGRSDECRDQTEAWLDRHELYASALYMRRAGDHRPDDIVKKELLQQMLAEGYRPILFIDDRKRVVDMWRAEGFTCLQCAPGDF